MILISKIIFFNTDVTFRRVANEMLKLHFEVKTFFRFENFLVAY